MTGIRRWRLLGACRRRGRDLWRGLILRARVTGKGEKPKPKRKSDNARARIHPAAPRGLTIPFASSPTRRWTHFFWRVGRQSKLRVMLSRKNFPRGGGIFPLPHHFHFGRVCLSDAPPWRSKPRIYNARYFMTNRCLNSQQKIVSGFGNDVTYLGQSVCHGWENSSIEAGSYL